MVIFWISLLVISILLYLLLDGFDLGVGMLFGLTRSEDNRSVMLNAVAPVWDGNETWLVVTGVILWGAFPIVYATLLSAFYIPVIIMLLGLVLRGVSFEYRNKAVSSRWLWEFCFAAGSLAASFMQGVMVGAMVEGLQFTDGRYSGGVFGWFTTFALLCGVGLCLGYALLGACWLVRKCEGKVQAEAYRLIPALSLIALAVLTAVFIFALREHLQVLGRWIEQPYLFIFPLLGIAAGIGLILSVRRRRDLAPFCLVAATFAAAFCTFAISFWPYMIPFSITVEAAAAPHASLAFMFWGEGLFVLPLMLIYTATSYGVFRGKVGTNTES